MTRLYWRSIRVKLVAPIGIVSLLVLGLIAINAATNYLDFEARHAARTAASETAARESLRDKLAQARNFARVVARTPEVGDAVDANDLRVLTDAVVPVVEYSDLTTLTLYDRTGVILARGEAPAVFGHKDELSPWLETLRFDAQTPYLDAVVRWRGGVYLVCAAPVATLGRPVGAVVVAGYALTDRLLAGIREKSGVDTAALFDGRLVARSQPVTQLPDADVEQVPVRFDPPLASVAPFQLEILLDDTPARQTFWRRLAAAIAALMVAAGVVTAGALYLILHTITRPLADMTEALTALADGQSDVVIPCRDRLDEIGAMARAAGVFQQAMARTIELTEAAAQARLEQEQSQIAARAHAEAVKQLRSLVTASPVPLLLCETSAQRVLLANAAACDFFAASEDDLRRTPVPTLLADPQAWDAIQERLAALGRISHCDLQWRGRDGRLLWGSLSVRQVDYEGLSTVLLGIADITQRKHFEGELQTAKETAESALADLQLAQDHLIQSEKMASLSLVVAGVAHEINTPLGIALTAVTHLKECTDTLAGQVETGRLRRSDLDTYMGTTQETVGLAFSNINRAAELVQSFKQVAVDQTSEERRNFDLPTYIEEVLSSLRPRFRRGGHCVSVSGERNIAMDSYPGALAQVLTNFVINSLVHGFEGDVPGMISITVAQHGSEAEITYRDDGKGIPPDQVPRVFEPFFTTKRGSGGTGLGLHIVYNLITHTLGGRIDVTSVPGAGTTFTVLVPCVAPGERA